MRSLADLPFGPVEPLRLLGLDSAADGHGEEHALFGWCRLPAALLRAPGQRTWVEAPLVLALHSPDDESIAVPLRGGVPSDSNREFALDAERSAVALLSEFLAARAPAVVGDAQAIVLALCNPRKARISKPKTLAGRRIYYGTGDVVAWLPRAAAGPTYVELTSDRWYTC
jgi:hypothetical protein